MPETRPGVDIQNAAYAEELYLQYLQDPSAVSEDWRSYFASFERTQAGFRSGPAFSAHSLFNPPGAAAGNGNGAHALAAMPASGNGGRETATLKALDLQDRVDQLVRAYRVRGHLVAKIDPLGLSVRGHPELDPAFFGIRETDLQKPISSLTFGMGKVATVGELIEHLRATYCQSIGVQYMHIDNLEMTRWLMERMEGTRNRRSLTHDEQLDILTRLTDAVIFEEFIQKKYIGAKSFSLEGGESFIPLLAMAIDDLARNGVAEIIVAMAHRGRLNVLANIMRKSPRDIFREYEDKGDGDDVWHGDVKYHLGYSSDWTTPEGKRVHLSLCFNASHLEIVNPIALGRVRSKQDRIRDQQGDRCVGIVIHGDSAVIGEGITQETLNLSELAAYSTGGTIHIVLNNQIGYTTQPNQARSTTYATDIAKMLEVPIFHVNGEDPEAVAQVVRLAVEFRTRFKKDVFIDMYCYRRRGHNEGDEPTFTQPRLYEAIRARKPVREGYLDFLLAKGDVSKQVADDIVVKRREYLEAELSDAKKAAGVQGPSAGGGLWVGYVGGEEHNVAHVGTGMPREELSALLRAISVIPSGFKLNPKIERLMELRLACAAGEKPLDWATAEHLAFASLVARGHRIRMTGQDAERGTFSHRHAVLHDYATGERYMPLEHVSPKQGVVDIHNSALSEMAVLGFEYGYSLDYPDGLTIWEAQFGDFVNVAQVVIDQFIVSAEAKWGRLSGLVMLLPHGFEGMGPEHSSARLERFLNLANADNIQVLNLTTPAQFFHALRRQVLRPWRKPLIVMTPKSLLRNPQAVSPLEDFQRDGFQRFILDDLVRDKPPARVILCTGKIFYELRQARQEKKREDVAIIRVEQLYPMRPEDLALVLQPFPDGTPTFWVQEEPSNMGAWQHIRLTFGEAMRGRLRIKGISRPTSASPATGSAKRHALEQRRIIDAAFSEQS